VKDFISVVSKVKALPRAGTLTCRIRFKLPNWQLEPVVQRAEDDTYLQLYRQMARQEQELDKDAEIPCQCPTTSQEISTGLHA